MHLKIKKLKKYRLSSLRKRQVEHYIVTSVKLIAPAIDTDFATGYEM